MSVLVGLSGIFGLPLTIRMIARADFFSLLFFLPCAPLAFGILGLFMVWGDVIRTAGIVVHSILWFVLALFTLIAVGGMLHFFAVYG